jgi:tagaturonate reductase
MEILHAGKLSKEAQLLLALPPKVLQFGTGVLLRGLPDYYIHLANQRGVFNGRIVVVKSTDKGSTEAYERQQNLYTHWMRGVVDGETRDDHYINASIYAVHNAVQEWEMILKYAEMPSMEVIISNTTEAGIRLQDDQVHAAPPHTFPGKLLSFLYHRYRTFSGDPTRGMVIVPTELITDNGQVLLSVLLELAHQHGFETAFIDWLENANMFCSSLVDRIVPGAVSASEVPALDYQDDLMIMSEPYGLWAIETQDPRVHEVLSFADEQAGVILAPDISRYRERKLRLLNGVHSFSCGIALLAAHATVLFSMRQDWMVTYMTVLMKTEISPLLVKSGISQQESEAFGDQVLDRFRNPFLQHAWINIAAQFSAKMQMRTAFLLRRAAAEMGHLPKAMAVGFAAYILATPLFASAYPNDPAVRFWAQTDLSSIPRDQLYAFLDDEGIWGTEKLSSDTIVSAIESAIKEIQQDGIIAATKAVATQKMASYE